MTNTNNHVKIITYMGTFSEPNPYDLQARDYRSFADSSFSWRYIEAPALDELLSDHYSRGDDVQALDFGCGNGRSTEHLIEHGINEANITGMDSSGIMIDYAADRLPQAVSLVKVNEDEGQLPFSDESFDLVVANMVLHAMDSQRAEAAIGQIGRILMPGGDFVIVDSLPDPDVPINQSSVVQTPWGSMMKVFNHDMDALLHEVPLRHGLECAVEKKPLKVDEVGREADLGEYTRYTTGHFRLAAVLHKPEAVSEDQ